VKMGFDLECLETGRLQQHYGRFLEVLQTAEGLLGKRDSRGAAAYAQIAAEYACENHAGLLSCRRLEAVLSAIGAPTSGRGGARYVQGDRGIAGRRLLHVLTRAESIGGHTRTVWRWIRNDPQHSHSVVLTRQRNARVPDVLERAVRESGGRVHRLDWCIGGLPARARALRRLAVCADRIVLHVHPYDVVASIAFASRSDLAPVLFVNHADHLFWVGTECADTFAHIRQSGLSLSLERRGLAERDCVVLPIPLEQYKRAFSRRVAKRRLGIPEDAVVLLSVASGYKYSRVSAQSFLDVVVPVIREFAAAYLLVVGPQCVGDWHQAMRETGGRARALGPREDPSMFYDAADVYVDSYPFASLTSMLEAGLRGVPLLAYTPHRRLAPVFCSDDISLGHCLSRASEPRAFQEIAASLIRCPEDRDRMGEIARERILAEHTGSGWRRHLALVLDHGAKSGPAGPHTRGLDNRREEDFDRWLALFQLASRSGKSVEETIRCHAGLLPFPLRLAFWKQMRAPKRLGSCRVLAPEWFRGLLERLASR
jgi:hypothetical protein